MNFYEFFRLIMTFFYYFFPLLCILQIFRVYNFVAVNFYLYILLF